MRGHMYKVRIDMVNSFSTYLRQPYPLLGSDTMRPLNLEPY